MSFTKYDTGKVRPTLFPVEAIEAILPVIEYGAAKYAVNNWRKSVEEPNGLQRYKDALMRHWMEYLKDPMSVDEESGLRHLHHAACNMIFLASLDKELPEPYYAGQIMKVTI